MARRKERTRLQDSPFFLYKTSKYRVLLKKSPHKQAKQEIIKHFSYFYDNFTSKQTLTNQAWQYHQKVNRITIFYFIT